MKTLESFMKKNKGERRQSKLEPYKKEIITLYKKSYKVEQIQEFLEKNGIQVSLRYIYKFLKQNLSTKKFSFKNPAALKNKNETISQVSDNVSFQNLKKMIKDKK